MILNALRPYRFIFPLAALLAFGCNEPQNTSTLTSQPPAPPAEAPDQAQPNVQARKVIGQTTQDIRDLATEREQENVNVAGHQITATDPITLPGNAYVTQTGRVSILAVDHALNLYNALHDRYPADHEEFMSEIIHANNIALPQLPAYQEYAYDADNHQLVVLEYPDRRENLRQQFREKTGQR